MIEFLALSIGCVFIFLFMFVCWVFIFLGCLFEFIKCVVCFRFTGIPERLEIRSNEIKKWCYDLSIMAADAFKVDENI